MSMKVERISLERFRSYDRFALSNLGSLTILVGPNAVGKTNAVEGIQLVTACASFRRAKAAELVKEGETSARVAARITDGSRELDVELRIEEGRRGYRLNGKPKRAGDLRGILPAVTFCPDDLLVVKGGHAGRRSLIDALGDQLSPQYEQVRRDYEKAVHQKNRLLKDEESPLLVASASDLLASIGGRLSAYRAALVARMQPLLADRYAELTDREGLAFRYVPSWQRRGDEELSACRPAPSDAERVLRELMDACADEERARKVSVVGPHADGFVFELDGKDASVFASQGQQRSIVLAFKLAEMALIEEMLHARPILLLDDVMSELDESRRAALSRAVAGASQAFVTTTNLSYFTDDVLAEATVVPLSFEGDRHDAVL